MREPLPKVVQWRELCDKWEKPTGCPTALALAVIHQESGGRPAVTRYETGYERKYGKTAKNQSIAKQCKLSTRDLSTSYGLMQLMFPLAYGYGARATSTLLDPDQNIRFGMAHLGAMLGKAKTPGAPLTDEIIRSVAGRYNGAGEHSQYAQNICALYALYDKFLRGE